MDRRPSKLAAVIVVGTFIGGAVGFYVRENWNLKGREKRLVELEELVMEKKAKIEQLRNRLKSDKSS